MFNSWTTSIPFRRYIYIIDFYRGLYRVGYINNFTSRGDSQNFSSSQNPLLDSYIAYIIYELGNYSEVQKINFERSWEG